MKAHAVEQRMKKAIIIEQLHKSGYKDTQGKSYKELRHKLAVARAMEIEPDRPGMGWF